MAAIGHVPPLRVVVVLPPSIQGKVVFLLVPALVTFVACFPCFGGVTPCGDVLHPSINAPLRFCLYHLQVSRSVASATDVCLPVGGRAVLGYLINATALSRKGRS